MSVHRQKIGRFFWKPKNRMRRSTMPPSTAVRGTDFSSFVQQAMRWGRQTRCYKEFPASLLWQERGGTVRVYS